MVHLMMVIMTMVSSVSSNHNAAATTVAPQRGSASGAPSSQFLFWGACEQSRSTFVIRTAPTSTTQLCLSDCSADTQCAFASYCGNTVQCSGWHSNRCMIYGGSNCTRDSAWTGYGSWSFPIAAPTPPPTPTWGPTPQPTPTWGGPLPTPTPTWRPTPPPTPPSGCPTNMPYDSSMCTSFGRTCSYGGGSAICIYNNTIAMVNSYVWAVTMVPTTAPSRCPVNMPYDYSMCASYGTTCSYGGGSAQCSFTGRWLVTMASTTVLSYAENFTTFHFLHDNACSEFGSTYLGSTQPLTLQQCMSDCVATAECAFVNYCPTARSPCVGWYANRCSFVKGSCTANNRAALAGYKTYYKYECPSRSCPGCPGCTATSTPAPTQAPCPYYRPTEYTSCTSYGTTCSYDFGSFAQCSYTGRWMIGMPSAPPSPAPVPAPAHAPGHAVGTTCADVKSVYTDNACCNAPAKHVGLQILPNPSTRMTGTNPCFNKKPTGGSWDNKECFKNGILNALEQAGGDVSKNAQNTFNSGDRTPITSAYWKNKMCPVNVHWHVGAEHRSEGEFDENGKSPHLASVPANVGGARRLASAENPRYGFACHKYDANDPKFTTTYDFKHCLDMHVGETYEIHWPHSALGACNTPYQFQAPFYDGVFCHYEPTGAHAGLTLQQVAHSIGVQSQVFTVVNDEHYYYPNLINGMLVDGSYGQDVAAYTGSTTGTSRDNSVCSGYVPITWQVDRKCQLISASSFDKLCADMKQLRDDMSEDLHPHGSRELVWKNLTANNLVDTPGVR